MPAVSADQEGHKHETWQCQSHSRELEDSREFTQGVLENSQVGKHNYGDAGDTYTASEKSVNKVAVSQPLE